MKKLLALFSLAVLCLVGMSAQQFLAVIRNDGTPMNFPISELDSVFILPDRDYVDLGLPSGILWATCNVGADSPEEYGDYLAWGETTPKSEYLWSTYLYGSAANALTKYCTKTSYGLNGYTDGQLTLTASDDAAVVNWGGDWRMPTLEDIRELNNNCSSFWTTLNGKAGRMFTGPNGNTLFLPAAGYYNGALSDEGSVCGYWSSTLVDYRSDYAYLFYLTSSRVVPGGNFRHYGCSVRPVMNP